jgi:hypothetical protein
MARSTSFVVGELARRGTLSGGSVEVKMTPAPLVNRARAAPRYFVEVSLSAYQVLGFVQIDDARGYPEQFKFEDVPKWLAKYLSGSDCQVTIKIADASRVAVGFTPDRLAKQERKFAALDAVSIAQAATEKIASVSQWVRGERRADVERAAANMLESVDLTYSMRGVIESGVKNWMFLEDLWIERLTPFEAAIEVWQVLRYLTGKTYSQAAQWYIENGADNICSMVDASTGDRWAVIDGDIATPQRVVGFVSKSIQPIALGGVPVRELYASDAVPIQYLAQLPIDQDSVPMLKRTIAVNPYPAPPVNYTMQSMWGVSGQGFTLPVNPPEGVTITSEVNGGVGSLAAYTSADSAAAAFEALHGSAGTVQRVVLVG